MYTYKVPYPIPSEHGNMQDTDPWLSDYYEFRVYYITQVSLVKILIEMCLAFIFYEFLVDNCMNIGQH